MTPDIRKIIPLSTAHIRESTDKVMLDLTWLSLDKIQYGYLIWVPEDELEDLFPDEAYLDCDGQEIAELHHYETP